MPTQLKLSDILNMISIGVLFELILLFFFYSVDKEKTILNLNKIDPTVLTGLSLILSFPLWRIISNFVEFIMYSGNPNITISFAEKDKKIFKKAVINIYQVVSYPFRFFYVKFLMAYRFSFFGMKVNDGIHGADLVRELITKPMEVNKLAIKNIEKLFGIKVGEIPESEYITVFYQLKCYLTIHNNNSELQSHKYGMVLNYHVRLAILSNILTIGSIAILLFNAIDKWYFEDLLGNLFCDKFLYIAILSALISRHFGGLSKEYSIREKFLIINDLNAMCVAK